MSKAIFPSKDPREMKKNTSVVENRPMNFDAYVDKAQYCVSESGKISTKIGFDIDSILYDLHKEYGEIIPIKYRNITSLCEGDLLRFTVYIKNVPTHVNKTGQKIEITANMIKPSSNNHYERIELNPSKMTTCPICGSTTSFIGHDRYCLNPGCPAKVVIRIRKFLLSATKVTWGKYELLTFNKLCVHTKIKNIADIFKLTKEQYLSLDVWFSNLETYAASNLHKKLYSLLGKVSFYDYLDSLGLYVHTSKPELNIHSIKNIGRAFPTIDEFIVFLKDFVPDNNTCLCTPDYIFILNKYLNDPNMIEEIKELFMLGLFKETCTDLSIFDRSGITDQSMVTSIKRV